jgi:general secretion pathway protein M
VKPLTRREHVLVSYAALGAGLLALAFALLRAPVSARAAFASELADLRPVYSRSVAALARSEAVRTEVDARRAADDTRQFYEAETAALAGATLQNDLRALIETEGGVLTSTAFRQTQEEAPVTPVSVNVRLHCSVESLLRILHGLEGRQPILFVENLVIQSRHRKGAEPQFLADELDVEFDATGYLGRALAP